MEKLLRTNWFPMAILVVMFLLMLGSSLKDSAIMDELAHIPAGYSYLKFQDYRLNPEHPPLAKALAAVPLLFLHLNYPKNASSWTTDINGQWDQGAKFLYESGNNPDQILFWARLPMMLLTILLGALTWYWVKKQFDPAIAAITLLLYAFSPTFLAHGHYVTTDVAASVGFFIGIVTYLKFLESPTWRNTIVAGVALGIAELLKFSTVLLIPIYAVFLIIWPLVQTQFSFRDRIKMFWRLLGRTILIGAIAFLVISLVYSIFILHYPKERQISDSQFLLGSFGKRIFPNIQQRLIQIPLLRPFAHYFLGVLMVTQRAAGGNTTYFLGAVSNTGSRAYFPLMFLTKESLAALLLGLIALCLALARLSKNIWNFRKIVIWVRNHFTLFAAGLFILFYWGYSMRTPLNIGIRHVLPTFPFIYLLISREVVGWLRPAEETSAKSWKNFFHWLYSRFLVPLPRYMLVSGLLLWLVIETILTYPSFLSYYNKLGGGTENGYRVAVDSNYDWGQDLKRLREYVQNNGIQKINLDYFGGGSPRYYFGDRFEPWWSARGPAHGYFAVSVTFLEGAVNPTINGLTRKDEDSYNWLKPYTPIARAGTSIFIYNLP